MRNRRRVVLARVLTAPLCVIALFAAGLAVWTPVSVTVAQVPPAHPHYGPTPVDGPHDHTGALSQSGATYLAEASLLLAPVPAPLALLEVPRTPGTPVLADAPPPCRRLALPGCPRAPPTQA